MSYVRFKPTIWSQHIQHELENASVMLEDCNTEFEGEAKHGARVRILGVNRPTVKNYTGIDIGAPEELDGQDVYLEINQAKYFNIGIDDIDKAQSMEGLMPAMLQEAATALAQERDRYIAHRVVDAGKQSDSLSITDAASAKAAVDDAFVWLWSNNVKISDEVVITVTPWFYNLFKEALTTLYTDNLDLIKRGIVGMYNGAVVKISTNLYNNGTDDFMAVRTKKAMAFAGQISQTEAYRPAQRFQDAVKGLDTFGAAVVRPKEIYAIRAHNS